jgi:glycerate-2-kinase
MHNRHDFIIVAGDAACLAAEQQAKSLGFHAMILSTMLEGESRELGRTFAAIANEVQSKKRPLPPPAAIIGGGETTVRITGNQEGTGGPNQEFALAASLGMDDAGNTVVVGFDTDGTDGPSEVAGGIVDEQTLKRAREMGIDIDDALNRHDVTPVFEALKDAIHTGATGTNVNDLKLLLVS